MPKAKYKRILLKLSGEALAGQNGFGIDADTHEMITEISEKLRSLSEMMYDYMVLKFKKNSYLESMLFYQRTVAAVNLCLDSLDKIRQISIMQTDKTKRKNK